MITAYILTHCRRAELLYGTTLTFRTLRVGFPTARVVVVDNDSLPEVRPVIRAEALAAGCEYQQLDGPNRVAHHTFIARTIRRHPAGTLVFLDPDLLFWDRCEEWETGKLVAGRVIPTFDDPFSGCVTHARAHTSFLWFEDVARLRAAIELLQRRYFDFDPFTPYMFRQGECWWRFDTGASLYAALGEHGVYSFGERELDRYDHLFCGCHLDLVSGALDATSKGEVEQSHALAQTNYRELRGLWRSQARYFDTRRVAQTP
jgi:hypothetical protein